MVPTVVDEIVPYSALIASFPSLVTYCNAFFMSSRSTSGSLLSSHHLNSNEITPPCVSLRSRILEKRTGPNSLTVALNLTPTSPERDKNSTGLLSVKYGRPMVARRSVNFGFSSAALAIPDKSPLISMSTQGTPLAESCSAIICKVFVLPVPVAPAIRPCRFNVLSGIFTK